MTSSVPAFKTSWWRLFFVGKIVELLLCSCTIHDILESNGGGTMEKRNNVSISLSREEHEVLRQAAKEYQLSLSAFLRLAAHEYIRNHSTKDHKMTITEGN